MILKDQMPRANAKIKFKDQIQRLKFQDKMPRLIPSQIQSLNSKVF